METISDMLGLYNECSEQSIFWWRCTIEVSQPGGWVEPPADLQPSLEGDVKADVIVVGAGFAGLSTALELRALGAQVILLEQEFAGFGASGRNAGYLLGSMGIEYDMFVKRLGVAQATQFVRFYDEAVPYVEGRMKTLGIDCDYNPSGVLRAGIHLSQKTPAAKHGIGSKVRGKDPLRGQFRNAGAGNSAGLSFRRRAVWWHVESGKYVGGLRRAAIEAG